MFLEAQGHKVTTNKFAQDNQSAMKLEMNGRASCGQKSRHINIRYFFIKDRIKSEGISIEYCPTEAMLADFFTKPLQGNLFRMFRDVLMGRKHVDTLSNPPSTPLEERVEIIDPGMKERTGVDGQTEPTKELKEMYATMTKKWMNDGHGNARN